MAQAWQTLEEAALTLGISSRTLHRRITKGDFESRLNNNRREVLVSIPDPEPISTFSQAPIPVNEESRSVALSEVADNSSSSSLALSNDVANTMLTLTEDRLRRTDLAIMAYQQSVTTAASEARRGRVSSRIAWGTAGVLTICLVLAITWTTHRLTAADAQVRQLSVELESKSKLADNKEKEALRERFEAESARIQAARSAGELEATRTQLNAQKAELQAARAQEARIAEEARLIRESQPPTTQPTTQPASLVDRMKGLLSQR